jgi:mannose-6-phosphate isomerase-like protein (cupin superfamily)
MVVRRDGRETLDLGTGVTWDRLTAHADPDVDFLFVTYGVGGASSPPGQLMRHSGREYGLIISGRLEVAVGFESCVLEPGDSVSFESTTPHRLANAGDVPTTAAWIVIGRHGSDLPSHAFPHAGD